MSLVTQISALATRIATEFNSVRTAIAAAYTKPSGGIPKTDLASAVQTSLGKADTALQSAPVTSVNTKTGAVTLTASDVGAASSTVPVVAKTAAYTLALTDAGSAVEVTSASAVSVTVPPNSSVAFPVGTVIEVAQLGTGQVTIAPGSGVTINSPGSLTKTRTQYSSASLRKRGTDAWLLVGDLA